MKVPVIATGGIGNARGIVAALAFGAQVCNSVPRSCCARRPNLPPHRAALRTARMTDGAHKCSKRTPARGLINGIRELPHKPNAKA